MVTVAMLPNWSATMQQIQVATDATWVRRETCPVIPLNTGV